MRAGAWWVVLCGCGSLEPAGSWPYAELPACELAEAAWEEGKDAESCVSPGQWGAECGSPASLSREGLLYAGEPSEDAGWTDPRETFVIDTAEDWAPLDDILDELGPLPEVDFTVSQVVVVVTGFGSACGASIDEHGTVAESNGATSLYVAYENRTGACSLQCDRGTTFVIAYAVPRAEAGPNVCTATTNRCEDY